MSSSKGQEKTLCWDCRKATKPNECPWVKNYTPVKGWTANKTHLGGFYRYDSFHITDCPIFKRDSFNGGAVEDVFGRGVEPADVDNDGLKELAIAIIERYVEDWKFLDYGKLTNVWFCGGRVNRRDVLEFFGSAWFDDLVVAAELSVSGNDICKALHITDRMIREVFQ